ncbi:hypothetical protein D9M68_264780 [compost metagenome]
MGADFQHAPVEQALLQLAHRAAVGVARGGAEGRQLAVGHHLGERPVRLDRRQPAELQEAPVPQLQRALGVDHGDALGQVVHRALQQVRLLRHRLFAAQGLALLDLGDVGVEDHQPALAGRPLADPHPAAVVQAVKGLGVAALVFLDDQPGALRQALDLGQPGAGADPRATARPERLEAAVEQHNALLLVEQHEGVGNALDGIEQVLVGGLGTQAGGAEQLVAGLQLGHRLVQRVGALAHLLGEGHRVLEGPVGIVAARAAGLDAFDQRGVDALQLALVLLQRGDPRLQLSARIDREAGRWRRR